MKHNKILLFLLSTLVFVAAHICIAQTSQNDSEWYPFSFPKNLAADSPLNIGKLVLDAPAGKHGFVKIQNGHFYFEDGTRAKFWGTNLCFNANFPDKKMAEIMADRIAFFGFNAVRLHHMDDSFESHGIFKDIVPDSKDPQMKKTGVLSQRQLDRLDYFIYLLEQRGIYIDMNLLVGRHFTKADGVVDAEKFGEAAKPVSMFDPKLIELQKQYAKDLLTHFNPYTRKRYADDPAIAIIEITNENSLIKSWESNKLNGTLFSFIKNPIPPYYTRQLDHLWNEWLNKKYGTKNLHSDRPVYQLLYSYSQQSQDDIKQFYTDLQSSYFEQMTSFLHKNIGIKVPITGIGGFRTPDDIKSLQTTDFIDFHTYWDHPKFPNRRWDHNDFKINNNHKLGMVGAIDKARTQVPKDKPFTITEWDHCFPNQYAYETPVLMGIKAQESDWDALFQFTFFDGWKKEPDFTKIQGFFDSGANPQQLILIGLGGWLFLKNTEIHYSLNDDVLEVDTPSLSGAVGFLKEKNIEINGKTVRPSENGAVFVFSGNSPLNESKDISLITIGEVKNTDEGWINGKFHWGKAPILLKKLEINYPNDQIKRRLPF
jgi:hypothetical protein